MRLTLKKSHFLSFKEVNEADCLILECAESSVDSELDLRPREGSPVVDTADRLMCFGLGCPPWPPTRGGLVSLFKRCRGNGTMGTVGGSSTDVFRLTLGLLLASFSSLTGPSPFTSCII